MMKVGNGPTELEIVLELIREHAPPPLNIKLADVETLRKVVNAGITRLPPGGKVPQYDDRCTVHRLAMEAHQEHGKGTRKAIWEYILEHPDGEDMGVYTQRTLFEWISQIVDLPGGRPKATR